MSELEEKLGTILSNPQLMQQIASMAQALGQSPEPPAPQPKAPPTPSLPDPAMLQSLSGMLQAGHIDQEQRELLRALSPFLSQARIGKLERAMRAAKMAGFASVLLRSGGLNLFGGR
ncbi:MAG: hypothetical protein Q4F81_08365 [Eubacteriales bacterium]|nr:hypothetical protein [Eubacteriales bacterium]